MKQKLLNLSLFVFLALAGLVSNKAYASHAMGMDMYYECLGGQTYRFTLNFYRDCNGVSAPTLVTLNLNSASCSRTATVTLPLISGPTEVSPLCASQLLNSACATPPGPLPGVQRYIYSATYTFPPGDTCADWIISYTLCCRNNAITNLGNPGNQSQYISTRLNNTGGLCNNSPQFTSLPTPFICAGQPYFYNHGAFDPDGDSLVYAWANPQTTGGTNIAYTPPQSAMNPFNGVETLDSMTGSMFVLPTAALSQFVVVAIDVFEYRGGVLIGVSRRDLQIVVMAACGNTQPMLVPMGYSSLTGSGIQIDSNSVQVCPGGTVSFQITGVDTNTLPVNNVTMTSNVLTVIPAATFTTAGSNPTIGTFTWSPSLSDSGFRNFTVTIVDDGCPILGAQVFSFDIRVVKETNAGPDVGYCPAGGPVQLSAGGGTTFLWTMVGGAPAIGLNCTNCANPIASPPGPAPATYNYEVTSNLPGICKNKDTIRVNVNNDFLLSAGPDATICQNGAFTLAGSHVPSTGGPVTPSWSPFGTVSYPNIFTPIAFPTYTTNYVLTGVDSMGCTIRDTARVTVSGVGVIVDAGANQTICPPGNANLSTTISRPCQVISDACTGSNNQGTITSATPTTSDHNFGPFMGPQCVGPGGGPPCFNKSFKQQMILLNTELDNIGLGAGGKIDTLWFFVDTLGTRSTSNLTITMGCTARPDFTGGTPIPYTSALPPTMDTVAFYASLPTPVSTGWYPIRFNRASYNYDGFFNLIIQICTSTQDAGTGPDVRRHITSPDSLYMFSSLTAGGGCGTAGGTGRTIRPDVKLSFCASNPAGLTYSWSPVTGLGTPLNQSTTASPASTTTYTVSVVNGACISADFVTVTVNCILPVQQLNFHGFLVNNGVQLKWDTYKENNTSRFVIEKSTNSNDWSYLGSTKAQGYTTGYSDYQLLDPNPNVGSNFYRLLQYDTDGKSNSAQVVEVVYSLESALSSVYPNPSEPNTGFFLNYFAAESAKISVSLFDINGKKVISKEYNLGEGSNTLEFPTHDQVPGIYILKVNNGSRSEVRKVILSK